MKKIKDILYQKSAAQVPVIDKNTIESVFFSVLEKYAKNIGRADIKNFHFKDKNIFIGTIHPAIAGELWKKKERLKSEINELLGKGSIMEIKVK